MARNHFIFEAESLLTPFRELKVGGWGCEKVRYNPFNCHKQRLFRFLIKSEQFFKKSYSRFRDSRRERVYNCLLVKGEREGYGRINDGTGSVSLHVGQTLGSRPIFVYFFVSFPYIYLYMYNMRCSPRGEKRATTDVSRPLVRRKNSLIAKRVQR